MQKQRRERKRRRQNENAFVNFRPTLDSTYTHTHLQTRISPTNSAKDREKHAVASVGHNERPWIRSSSSSSTNNTQQKQNTMALVTVQRSPSVAGSCSNSVSCSFIMCICAYIYTDLQEVRLQIMIVVPFLCKLHIYSCNSYKFVCYCACMGACDCALSPSFSLVRSLSLYDFALFWLRVVNGAHWNY